MEVLRLNACWTGRRSATFADTLKQIRRGNFKLVTITCRAAKV